jgi:DNA-directed RNA polymerase specialized sigma24 family protein
VNAEQRSAFEELASANYDAIKDNVIATLRGHLAADNMHVDSLDLEAAYNLAWHALSEQMEQNPEPINNLGGWLGTVAYRKAIDDLRRSRGRLQAGHVAVVEHSDITDEGYEPDVDSSLDDRDAYHQWRISVRLRLNHREQQAVRLCLHLSHKEASERMGISANRLHKLMTSANKKLDGLLDLITRGDWCEEQRSLITAYALSLHEPGSERHQLAAAHLASCPACSSYVRALRGIAVVVPPINGLETITVGGGGLLGGLSGAALKGGGGGAAAGGGILTTIGVKTAAVCATAACAVGGAVVVIEHAPDTRTPSHPAAAKQPRSVLAANAPTKTLAKPAAKRTRAPTRETQKTRARGRTPPDPNSQAAQEISQFTPESQANSSAPAAVQPVQNGGTSEFGPE